MAKKKPMIEDSPINTEVHLRLLEGDDSKGVPNGRIANGSNAECCSARRLFRAANRTPEEHREFRKKENARRKKFVENHRFNIAKQYLAMLHEEKKYVGILDTSTLKAVKRSIAKVSKEKCPSMKEIVRRVKAVNSSVIDPKYGW